MGDRETLDSAGVPAEAQLKLVFESPSQNRPASRRVYLFAFLSDWISCVFSETEGGANRYGLGVRRGRTERDKY